MASSSTHIQDEEQTQQHSSPQDIKVNIRSYSDYFNRFLTLSFWVSRSFRKLHFTSRFSESTCLTGHQYSGMVKNNYVVSASSCSSSSFLEEEMCPAVLSSSEPGIMRRESDGSSEESSSASPAFWRLNGIEPLDFTSNNGGERAEKEPHSAENILENKGSTMSEMEMMKERLSKLLLGEDMSGCGNGVSTALTISNAITNLCATLFGQLWRLERTPLEKKAMWRREMECLLSVTDHIVELEPSLQTFSDGSKLEVMTCRPRSDVYINLPALRKLDNMLLEILDSFEDTEFWYVDQGILAPEVDGTSSSREGLRQEEKWWLPIPRVPPDGLSEDFWRNLQNKRERTNQIFKAAMAINAIVLAEMEVPESYLSALPKNARTSLGDTMYRNIISDQFFPDHLLNWLDLSSEHQAIEIANRVEASIFIWRNRTSTKPMNSKHTRSSSKSSWDLMKELMVDSDKRELLADRAEGLLHCLKQRFPGLPQTTLDMYKLQFNKDVGKAILESYSRVLESLAFTIMARIDDVFYVNSLTKQPDKLPSKNNYLGIMDHKKSSAMIPLSAPSSSTPYKTAFTTPSFSPTRVFSPVKGDQCSPFTINAKVNVKRALSDYFGTDGKGKELTNLAEKLGSSSSRMTLEASAAQYGREYELAGGLRKSSQAELAVEE